MSVQARLAIIEGERVNFMQKNPKEYVEDWTDILVLRNYREDPPRKGTGLVLSFRLEVPHPRYAEPPYSKHILYCTYKYQDIPPSDNEGVMLEWINYHCSEEYRQLLSGAFEEYVL